MSFRKGLILATGLAGLFAVSDALAAGKWAVGGIVDYHAPTKGMGKRFSSIRNFTGALSYAKSDAVTFSLEYNHAKFNHGKLETLPFVWSVDNKKYTSPLGRSTLKTNSYLINACVYPGSENQSHAYKPKDYRWYFLIGGGYVDYKQVNEGFVFAGQSGGVLKVLDTNQVTDPQIDKRVSLSANFGAGVEAFITDTWALDLRARYNFVVGEIRPVLMYNLTRVWPIQFLDIGGGMKFYFGR